MGSGKERREGRGEEGRKGKRGSSNFLNFFSIRYAHENGCEWDKETCESAADQGHLECLRYKDTPLLLIFIYNPTYLHFTCILLDMPMKMDVLGRNTLSLAVQQAAGIWSV